MTSNKKDLTLDQLIDGNPWDNATMLGINYNGDMNIVPHGGYYEDLLPFTL